MTSKLTKGVEALRSGQGGCGGPGPFWDAI